MTIGHRLAAPQEAPFFRWLRAAPPDQAHRAALAAPVRAGSRDLLGIPDDQLALVPYQVDTDFWQPQPDVAEERLICSAGLEFRDYPTLFEAVDGLDVRVVVGAASHWSQAAQHGARVAAPGTNVEIGSFDYFGAARALRARGDRRRAARRRRLPGRGDHHSGSHGDGQAGHRDPQRRDRPTSSRTAAP